MKCAAANTRSSLVTVILNAPLIAGAPGRSPAATPRRRAPPAAAGRSRAPRGSCPARVASARARARGTPRAPRAAAGCGAAPPRRSCVSGSCRLDPHRAIVRLLELGARRPHRGPHPVLAEVALHEPPPQVIAAALGENPPGHEPRRRREPARQPAQPEAQPAAFEVGGGGPAQEGVELADAAVLAAAVAEVLPRLEARRHGLRRRDRDPFVDEQLAQRRPAPRVPIIVITPHLGDEAAQRRAA